MLWTAQTTIHFETVSSFNFLSEEYRMLFARSGAYGFQHPVWLDAFYRNLAPGRGAEARILTGRENRSGRLELVLPMIRRRKMGFRLLEATDLGVSDYVIPVASPEFWSQADQAPDMQSGVLEALPGFDVLRIRPVRAEDRHKFELLLGAEAQPLGFSAHAVDIKRPYDDWRTATFNGSLRKMMDRKGRKLQREQDVSCEELRDPQAIRAALKQVADLREGRFEEDVIQEKFALDFYSDVAVRGAAAGLASTWQLKAGAEVVAVVFGLTHQGRFYYLLIGSDYDRFGQYSPGLQMYDAIMRDWSRRGGTCFDFTIGDEDFKMKFGTSPTPIYAFVQARGPVGGLAKSVLMRRYRQMAAEAGEAA